MTCNYLIDNDIIEELSKIMEGEKDRNHAPKSTKRNGKKDNKKEAKQC